MRMCFAEGDGARDRRRAARLGHAELERLAAVVHGARRRGRAGAVRQGADMPALWRRARFSRELVWKCFGNGKGVSWWTRVILIFCIIFVINKFYKAVIFAYKILILKYYIRVLKITGDL